MDFDVLVFTWGPGRRFWYPAKPDCPLHYVAEYCAADGGGQEHRWRLTLRYAVALQDSPARRERDERAAATRRDLVALVARHFLGPLADPAGIALRFADATSDDGATVYRAFADVHVEYWWSPERADARLRLVDELRRKYGTSETEGLGFPPPRSGAAAHSAPSAASRGVAA